MCLQRKSFSENLPLYKSLIQMGSCHVHTEKTWGQIMNAKNEFIYYETVLSYCITKIQSNNHDQAMHYGRLSGFFTAGNQLTPMGNQLAKYQLEGLKAA
jgi:hypothetical protein